jgi:carboxyl-terminal processing protease
MNFSFLRARTLVPALALSLLIASAQAQPTTTPETSPATPAALTKETKDEVLAALEEIVTKRAFVPGVDLSKWPEFLAKEREAIDKTEKEPEFVRAVNTAMRNFGISHIRFLAPRAAAARKRTSDIGIGVRARVGKEGLTVAYVFPKSPADVAGIREGEIITLIDGKLPDSAEPLQGEQGTEAALTVRAANGTTRELKLKREPYSTARIDTLTWIGDEAAVLKVHSFSRGYERATIDKLMGEAAKAKYLVLDLRSNGGGATNNLRHLLSLLMPEDTVIGTFISGTPSGTAARLRRTPSSSPRAPSGGTRPARSTCPPSRGRSRCSSTAAPPAPARSARPPFARTSAPWSWASARRAPSSPPSSARCPRGSRSSTR